MGHVGVGLGVGVGLALGEALIVVSVFDLLHPVATSTTEQVKTTSLPDIFIRPPQLP